MLPLTVDVMGLGMSALNRIRRKELEQQKEQKTMEKWNRMFSNVIKQWNTMKPENQEYYIRKAEELKDEVPNAKLVLAYRQSVPAELFSNG